MLVYVWLFLFCDVVATSTQGMSDDARIRELAELIRKKCTQQQAQVPGGQLPGSAAVAQVRRILTLLNLCPFLVVLFLHSRCFCYLHYLHSCSSPHQRKQKVTKRVCAIASTWLSFPLEHFCVENKPTIHSFALLDKPFWLHSNWRLIAKCLNSLLRPWTHCKWENFQCWVFSDELLVSENKNNENCSTRNFQSNEVTWLP